MANGSFVFFCKKKTQIILLKKNIFHKYCFVVDSLCLHQSINQSITQFFYVKTWDEVASIIHARGSCMKRMTIN